MTTWDIEGDWDGRVTLSGAEPVARSSTLSDTDPGSREDRIRLCELSALSVSLHFVPIEEGLPAAIDIRTDRALCRTGRTEVVTGTVRVWTVIAPETLAARPDEGWSVSGYLEIDDFRDFGLPDLDVGESVTTERASGSLVLSAQDGDAGIVLIEDGTFEMTVVARRFERSIS